MITMVDGEFVCNITKGMTNGEVIQALFPDIYVEFVADRALFSSDDGFGNFTEDWWNAPYKA